MNKWLKKANDKIFEFQYKDWQVLIILILLSLAVFWPSFLNLNFFWDDERFIFGNPEVLQAPDFFSFWNIKSPFFKSWPLGYGIFWTLLKINPVQDFIFFKSLNILIHALNGFLFFKLLKRFNFKYCLVAAAVFIVHPLHVETVSWVFQLLTLLAFTFFLMATFKIVQFTEDTGISSYLQAFTYFLFSLFIKSTALLSPFLFLTIFFARKVQFRKYLFLIPFFIFSLLIGMINQVGSDIVSNKDSSFARKHIYQVLRVIMPDVSQRLIEDNQKRYHDFIFKFKKPDRFDFRNRDVFAYSLPHYGQNLILPWDQRFIYAKEKRNIAVALIITLMLIAFPFYLWRKKDNRDSLILYGIYAATFLPFIGVSFITFFYWSYVADRYAYGMIALVSLTIVFLLTSSIKSRKGLVLFYCFYLIVTSLSYGLLFNNPLKLYTRIEQEFKHPVIYSLLIEENVKILNLKDASRYLETGKKLFPDSPVWQTSEPSVKALEYNLKQINQ